MEAKAKEAEALYKEYQKASASLSAAQKTQREEAIVAKEKEAAELRKKYFGPEGEMAKKQEALITPIQDKIYEAVKQISEQKGYAAVDCDNQIDMVNREKVEEFCKAAEKEEQAAVDIVQPNRDSLQY